MKDFYEKKTNEISQRMEVLVESAGTSGLNIKKQKDHMKSGLVESITQRFESMLHGNSVRNLNESSLRSSTVPDLDFEFSVSLDDEDPGRKLEGGKLDKKKKKEELARNSDSIKRAITDIYRTAKLLHNFSIMNYTGFVKIGMLNNLKLPNTLFHSILIHHLIQ